MIPKTNKLDVVLEKKKEIETEIVATAKDSFTLVCEDCKCILCLNPQKNILIIKKPLMVLFKNESIFKSYCVNCIDHIEPEKIVYLDSFENYQKKLKAGLYEIH